MKLSHTIATIVLTSTVAGAAPNPGYPYAETLSKAEVDAITNAVQAALPPVDQKAASACVDMLTPYYRDADHNVERAFEAANCLRAAGSLGAAINQWKMYLGGTVTSEAIDKDHARAALESLADTYLAVGAYTLAAGRAEDFIKKYGMKDTSAPKLALRAFCIRRQLGDITESERDAKLLANAEKNFNPDQACAQVRPIATPSAHESLGRR